MANISFIFVLLRKMEYLRSVFFYIITVAARTTPRFIGYPMSRDDANYPLSKLGIIHQFSIQIFSSSKT